MKSFALFYVAFIFFTFEPMVMSALQDSGEPPCADCVRIRRRGYLLGDFVDSGGFTCPPPPLFAEVKAAHLFPVASVKSGRRKIVVPADCDSALAQPNPECKLQTSKSEEMKVFPAWMLKGTIHFNKNRRAAYVSTLPLDALNRIFPSEVSRDDLIVRKEAIRQIAEGVMGKNVSFHNLIVEKSTSESIAISYEIHDGPIGTKETITVPRKVNRAFSAIQNIRIFRLDDLAEAIDVTYDVQGEVF